MRRGPHRQQAAVDARRAALAAGQRAATPEAPQVGECCVWFTDGWRQTPDYARDRLQLDAVFEGPPVLEPLDCPTVVEPGDEVRQDGIGNLLVPVGASA